MYKYPDSCKADIAAVKAVPVPEGSRYWHPVGHGVFVDLLEKGIKKQGLKVESKEYGLCRKNNQFFSVYCIRPSNRDKRLGYAGMLGGRNSIDQSITAAVCFGNHVFVCDNRAFTGDIVLKTKHTLHVMDRLPLMIESAVGQYGKAMERQRNLVLSMKQHELKALPVVHDVVVKAVRESVIPGEMVLPVLTQFETPEHACFKPKNAWSLYNAFTAVMGKQMAGNMVSGAQRTQKLTDLFRMEFDLA